MPDIVSSQPPAPLTIGLDVLVDGSPDSQARAWFEYADSIAAPRIPGLFFEIAWLSRIDHMELRERCLRNGPSVTSALGLDTDPHKEAEELAQHALLNWRGLTLDRLRLLHPIRPEKATGGVLDPGDWHRPIPYDSKLATALMLRSRNLQAWIVSKALDVVGFSAAPKAAEVAAALGK